MKEKETEGQLGAYTGGQISADSPETASQNEEFKAHIIGLQSLKAFQKARVKIRLEDIVEIDSKKHPIQQCMDIVMGAMAFELNKRDRVRKSDSNIRGRRTIAKSKMYAYILKQIRSLGRPNFNIGITTGTNSKESRWSDSYRHWLFEPSSYIGDKSKYKHK